MAWFRCTGGSGGSLKLRTASGAIASFETNLAARLNSLKCEITANQDLHGYDHPWAGGGGKNKLNPDYRENASNNIKFYNGVGGGVALQAGQAYTISVPNGSTHPAAIYLQDYSSGTEYTHVYSQRTLTYTPSANCNIKIDVYYANSDMPTEPLSSINVQLEKGSQATAYEPYSNICPLVGHSELNLTRCGVNIWDEEWEVIGSYFWTKNAIPVKPNTTYYLKMPTGISANVNVCDKNKTYIDYIGYIGNTTFTTPANCFYISLQISTNAYGSVYNNDISINPSSDTAYHAYNGDTFTVAFGQTVYGGVYDKSGRLTITHIGITRTWGDFGNKTALTNYTRGSLNISSEGKGVDNNTTDICNIAPYQYSWSSDTNHFYIQISGDNTYLYVFLPNDTSDDTEIQVCYELATPIVIDVQAISPSAVVGTNNVFGDTGDTEVKYLYIA